MALFFCLWWVFAGRGWEWGVLVDVVFAGTRRDVLKETTAFWAHYCRAVCFGMQEEIWQPCPFLRTCLPYPPRGDLWTISAGFVSCQLRLLLLAAFWRFVHPPCPIQFGACFKNEQTKDITLCFTSSCPYRSVIKHFIIFACVNFI